MNKHIELVEKWLADNDSVSTEELAANASAAYDTAYATYADTTYAAYADTTYATEAATTTAEAAAYAAEAAYAATTATYAATTTTYATEAAYWVAKYHKSVKEQGQ